MHTIFYGTQRLYPASGNAGYWVIRAEPL